jgi:putative nucleotidyltransferase with HDIG domain
MHLVGSEWEGESAFVVSLHDISERRVLEEERTASAVHLRAAMFATVNAIAATIEKRDPYTAGHQQRVAALAEAIACKMRLEEKRIEAIYLCGVIHDIGKISIPAEILNSPKRLNDLEFGLIKMHPESGYEILKDIPFEFPVAEIIRQHHERLDGSGYPRGLRGDAILLEARILCVADVIEAMASHRPYRPGFGIDVALGEIRLGRGALYDEHVVDVCLELFSEGYRLLEAAAGSL